MRPVNSSDLGLGGSLVNSVFLASGHDSPWKTAKLVAEDAADDEIRADQSLFSDQAEACRGNLKAMPG